MVTTPLSLNPVTPFGVTPNVLKLQLDLQGATIPNCTKLIHQPTQLLVNQGPPLGIRFLWESITVEWVHHSECDFSEFDGGDRRDHAKAMWRTHH